MFNKKKIQMSESILLNLILALSGGSMDAYSYLARGKVFANAQTGNILLLGVNLASANFKTALKFFLPITAFVLGIFLANIIRHICKERAFHWRQISVLLEIILLAIVPFISKDNNGISNGLISLACGIQVQSFQSIYGNSIATTMCIGNLRKGMDNLSKFIYARKDDYLKQSLVYFSVILFFMIGAIVEGYLIKLLKLKGIVFSIGLLIISFILMHRPFIKRTRI